MDKEEFINEASEEVAFEGEQIEVQNVKPGLVDVSLLNYKYLDRIKTIQISLIQNTMLTV